MQELPEDRWYCPNCTCDVCGVVVNIMEAPSAMATLECSQCQHRCNASHFHLSAPFIFCTNLLYPTLKYHKYFVLS